MSVRVLWPVVEQVPGDARSAAPHGTPAPARVGQDSARTGPSGPGTITGVTPEAARSKLLRGYTFPDTERTVSARVGSIAAGWTRSTGYAGFDRRRRTIVRGLTGINAIDRTGTEGVCSVIPFGAGPTRQRDSGQETDDVPGVG